MAMVGADRDDTSWSIPSQNFSGRNVSDRDVSSGDAAAIDSLLRSVRGDTNSDVSRAGLVSELRDGPAFLATLAHLRWLAIGCQVLTVIVVTGPLGMHLPAAPLWAATAVLFVFNIFATLRARRVQRVAPIEAFAHIAVDVLVLSWLIAWGGGIANPFTSLFLLPIAFAALALPVPWLYATATLCGIGYAASALFGRPMPHTTVGDGFNLHLIGMTVNFVISVIVVVYFLSRLAAAIGARERELATLRERFARNEGILALATHAASVAHELNTPLGSMTLLVDDLLEQPQRAGVRSDLESLRTIVDMCRDRVRALARPADDAAASAPVSLPRLVDGWRLLHPAIRLQVAGDAVAGFVPVHAAQVLRALLDNAAQASQAAGNDDVTLRLDAIEEALDGEVSDRGAGFGVVQSDGVGLGVGLALCQAIIEHHGGRLSIGTRAGGGTWVSFRLPLQPGG